MLAKTSLSTRFAFVQSRNVVALQQALKNHGNSVAHFSSNNSRVLAETIKTTVGTAAPKQTKQNDTATPASTKAAADPNFWTIRGSVNSVYLIGTVSSDPVFKQVANGSTMTSFSIVTSERIKKKDGTIQEQTNFHNIVSFDNLLARVAQKYLKKGFIVNVKGKLTYREVKKEGTDITYNVPQIVVSQFSDLKVIYGKVPRDQTQ
ncbi:hypothetical protein C9374_009958 [Naegleria lovaniensis]|uniref:Single-stranded DNA-binding protein, mitochondrial n=1 Tax=Naegleria lovaniensis TaxID=51637 RepID=A0AA88KE71_NAELO|nr:uncharacterized protein C9374_009958 [Naegleria lovaniensis]KAG2375335.1 hypothetical protein C9374_009958 [Naegleria lovaniensis]